MSKKSARLVISANFETIERLAVEDVLLRHAATAFSFECTDGDPSGKLKTAAANAVAVRLAAEQICYPVTPEALIEASHRAGVRAASAAAAVGQLQAEGSLKPDREMMPDKTAAEVITSRLAANPYLRVGQIRTVDQPAPEPAPEPIVPPAAPESPSAEGGWPTVIPYDPAPARERKELEDLATGNAEGQS